LESLRLKEKEITHIQTFCVFEENIVFSARFKMGRVCISMEKCYLNNPVCRVSTGTLTGQVVQLGLMDRVCIRSSSRGAEQARLLISWVQDCISLMNITQMVE